MAQLFVSPYVTVLDENGNPVSGGKIFFFETGTLTPETVYADADLTTPLSNPVVADANGRTVPIYLDPEVTYRARVTYADNQIIRDTDPYAVGGTGGGGASGASDRVYLDTFPGTTEDEDPERWYHSIAQLKNAMLATTSLTSPDYGKAVAIRANKGTGKRHEDEWEGDTPVAIDAVTGELVPVEFLADVGHTLIGEWTQNGRYEAADFPTPHDVDNLPGNLWSGARIIIEDGARVRRPPINITGALLPKDQHIHPCIFVCDPNPTPGTTVDGVDTQADVYKGIRITYEGDGCFLGENHRWGYREHHNDISLNAVSDYYVNTRHYGSMSDAVYLGAGNIGGGTHNRRNKRGYVEVWADGLNTNNRNVLSIVAAEDLDFFVRGRRFTKQGGAGALDPFDPLTGTGNPGIVDIEPNVSFTTDPYVSDIRGVAIAETSGSAGLALLLGDNDAYPNPTRGFRLTSIAIDCYRGAFATFGAAEMEVGYDAILTGSATNCYRPFEMTSGYGITLKDFTALDSVGSAYIGYFGQTVSRMTWDNVTLQRIGTGDTAAVQVRGADGWVRRNVTIIDANNKGFEYLAGLPIRGIQDDNVQGVVTGTVGAPVMQYLHYVNPADGGADMDFGTMSERAASYNLQNLGWMIPGGKTKNIPGVGTWRKGQEMFGDDALEPGAFRRIRQMSDGAPNFVVQEVIQPLPPLSAFGGTLSGLFPGSSLFNMRADPVPEAPGAIRLTATGPNARWVHGGAVASFTLELHAAFSGSQTVYAGGSLTSAPTGPGNVRFGVWQGDTTGGQLGRTIGVQSGNPAGTPRTTKFGDRLQISYQSGGASSVVTKTTSETTDQVIYSIGSPVQNLYPFVLIGIPGESIIIRGATI